MCIFLTWVYCGQLFVFISVSLLVIRSPVQRSSWWVCAGVELGVGRRGGYLLRLFKFRVTYFYELC